VSASRVDVGADEVTPSPARTATAGRVVGIVLVVVGCVLMFVRVRERIATPGIFAEDGVIFYWQAQFDGFDALLSPYAGYIHLVPRLFAAAFSPFGLPAVPLGYALTTTVVSLLCFATVLNPRLARVIPSEWARGLAFLALCLVPQYLESAGSLAYLIFIGGVALLAIGLASPPRTVLGRVVELVVVALFGLSGPLIVFYSPLYLYRWIRDRSWPNFLVLAVAGGTAVAQLVVYLTYGRTTQSAGFAAAPKIYLTRVVGELLAGPDAVESSFVPFWEAPRTTDIPALVLVAAVWLAVVLVVVLAEVRLDGLMALGVTAAALAGAANAYGDGFLHQWAGDRHILVPAGTLLILLPAAAAHAVARSRLRWRVPHIAAAVLAFAALAMTIGGIRTHFTMPRYDAIPTQAQLTAFQSCVDQGRLDCVITISPGGRTIDSGHPWVKSAG